MYICDKLTHVLRPSACTEQPRFCCFIMQPRQTLLGCGHACAIVAAESAWDAELEWRAGVQGALPQAPAASDCACALLHHAWQRLLLPLLLQLRCPPEMR